MSSKSGCAFVRTDAAPVASRQERQWQTLDERGLRHTAVGRHAFSILLLHRERRWRTPREMVDRVVAGVEAALGAR